MTQRESEAIAAICLMAAIADDEKSQAERDKLKEIFDTLGGGATPAVYRRVLLRESSLADEAAALETPDVRMLAYEMAVGVCAADGPPATSEREFLDRLRGALSLEAGAAAAIRGDADALASSSLEAGGRALPAVLPPAAATDPGADAEVDAMILRYAILNGGLELLPQSLATMAIVPLQMKMVYRIGKRYGHDLSRGHVGELLAAAGLGMGSQVVEGYARRLLGGLLGGKKGKALKGIAGTGVGAALSFGSTWAIGMVAKSYYAGGRRLDGSAIRDLFARRVEEGKRLFDRHRPEVEASARSTNLADVLASVRER